MLIVPNAPGAFVSGGSGAYRYYRIDFTLAGSVYHTINEIEFYDSSLTPLTGSGTATASSALSGQEASKAFDNDFSTLWGPSVYGVGATPWIQYDFGSPVAVAMADITPYVARQQASMMTLSGSNDGSNWTQLVQNTTEYYNNSYQDDSTPLNYYGRRFALIVPDAITFNGYSMYKMVISSTPDASGYLDLVQAEVRDNLGVDQLQSTSAWASARGNTARNLVDGSLTSRWYPNTTGGGFPHTFGVDCGLGNELTPTDYRMYGLYTGRLPEDWIFYGSNDGANWTQIDSRTGQSLAPNTWHTFTI